MSGGRNHKMEWLAAPVTNTEAENIELQLKAMFASSNQAMFALRENFALPCFLEKTAREKKCGNH